MKKLYISESAGFCFGVSRSVKLAEETLKNSGKPCFSLGELIHNDSVVNELRHKGLYVVSSAAEIPTNSSVIIRSHGVPKSDYKILSEKCAEIIDATCPKVKRIHKLVAEATENGRTPVIIGAKDHPEVIAICGWCDGAEVFANAEELKCWLDKDADKRQKPMTVVFQTTQTQHNLEEIKKILKKECTNCEVFDTICSATSIRQFDAAALSQKCGAMVVIGARHSANSVH
ncbi:MAG: 4-hydroxy-3-methylbut-2-enyl diphosphate reductase, partial [Clostridiales bacterium]|nr:4-hydroxy-3-methylbut-2-enyl diphosphate reductase [Clostridiales bacterium]